MDGDLRCWPTIAYADRFRWPDLCGIDVVRLYGSVARMPSGFVGLGRFYAKVARADR